LASFGFWGENLGFSRKRTSPQNPKPRGKNRICWGKSQISWGEKGKGKTQLLFSFNPGTKEEKQISRSIKKERPAKLDKGTEFKKAELCFSLAAAGCELAPWLAC
jgi:hypothetical protein